MKWNRGTTPLRRPRPPQGAKAVTSYAFLRRTRPRCPYTSTSQQDDGVYRRNDLLTSEKTTGTLGEQVLGGSTQWASFHTSPASTSSTLSILDLPIQPRYPTSHPRSSRNSPLARLRILLYSMFPPGSKPTGNHGLNHRNGGPLNSTFTISAS
jgi:hypothetical protein